VKPLCNFSLREVDADSTDANHHLMVALAERNPTGVNDAFERGADPNYRYWYSWDAQTPLTLAIEWGNLQMVRLLLKKGARALDLSESGVTYPAVAVLRGKTQVVELFADLMMLSCSNVSDSGESILAIAVQRGCKMFRRVLDLGVDARLKGRNGRTAIHEAARVAGGARCLNLMLGRLSLRDLGRALNDRDERGLTPLHWAAKETNAAALNLLIGYGANVSARDYNGCTALDILAQKI